MVKNETNKYIVINDFLFCSRISSGTRAQEKQVRINPILIETIIL